MEYLRKLYTLFVHLLCYGELHELDNLDVENLTPFSEVQ